MDDFRHHKEFFRQSRLAVVGAGENFHEGIGLKLELADGVKNLDEDIELMGFGDADSEERLSDISDSVLSMATETDGSIGSVVEYTLFPEYVKSTAETTEKPKFLPNFQDHLKNKREQNLLGRLQAKAPPNLQVLKEQQLAIHTHKNLPSDGCNSQVPSTTTIKSFNTVVLVYTTMSMSVSLKE